MNNMYIKSLASEIEVIPESDQFLFNGLLYSNTGGTSNEMILVKLLQLLELAY